MTNVAEKVVLRLRNQLAHAVVVTWREQVAWRKRGDSIAKRCIARIQNGALVMTLESWIEFTSNEGSRVQVVGDDLYVTNPERLSRGIQSSASNAILIKLNQIGTVTETINVINMAKEAGFATIMSHRSGETSDDIIADFAVGLNSGQIKTGAPARSDRTSKYNQLIRISDEVRDYSQLF